MGKPKGVAAAPPKRLPRAGTVRRLQVTHPRCGRRRCPLGRSRGRGPARGRPAAPPGHPPHLPADVRSVGACTADLHRSAEWLAGCRVKAVAMESTGVYWIPLFELLESRGFGAYSVDPRQSRHAPGRPKGDVPDGQWLQRLHSYGLLSASFRPAEPVVVLRGYLRQRQMVLRYAGPPVQHMQKALEPVTVKRAQVASDVTGVTGMGIIKAILAGERDPQRLAALRSEKGKRTREEMARALGGSWRAEPLFALKRAVELYEFHRQKMRACDGESGAHRRTFAERTGGGSLQPRPGGRGRRRRANDPSFEDVRETPDRMSGADLTALEGVDENTALVILSEAGPDASRFPSAEPFTSRLGLCPQHQGSAGRIRSRGVRRGANRAARAPRMAARGGRHAKNAVGAFDRRVRARAGAPKAIGAPARKPAERVSRLLRYGEAYVRPDAEAYEAADRARVVKGLARRAGELGYRLGPVAAAGG